MYDLKGKTTLITGAAKRIGRSLTIELAKHGATIVIHYHTSKNEAHTLSKEVEKLGAQAFLIQGDLANPNSNHQLIDEALTKAGTLDILINNASIFPTSTLHETQITDLNDTMAVNAWTPFTLCRRFSQKVAKGKIINFLDTRIIGYDFNRFSYYLSKKNLEIITRSLALKYAPHITVNAVAPGLILPPEGKDRSYLETLKNTLPLKRIGSISDITDAVLFLLHSDFITGQILFIDGGKHLLQTIEGA
jgi:NAD(P)-dependent dehydrogenase (short-subunit alcohol dehydrogenase family)